MSKKIITQIYEIQTPHEAHEMIELGVDRIGSVITRRDSWKIPQIKETIDLVTSTNANSSLIMLFRNQDDICRALDYYRPDIVHFCDDLVHCGKRGGDCEFLKHCNKISGSGFRKLKYYDRFPSVKKR